MNKIALVILGFICLITMASCAKEPTLKQNTNDSKSLNYIESTDNSLKENNPSSPENINSNIKVERADVTLNELPNNDKATERKISSDNTTNKTIPDFGIYLVKNMNIFQAVETDINKLTTEEAPLLTNKSTNAYYIHDNKLYIYKNFISKANCIGVPFVLKVNGKNVLLRIFWLQKASSLSNSPPSSIVIDDIENIYITDL